MAKWGRNRLGRICAGILGVWMIAGQPSLAADLKTLVTRDDSREFAAVGRLNLGARGFCTGTLIAPQLVLTAAHCLYDKLTGARHDATKIEFLAGWRDGRAEAYRGVRRAVAHPAYTHGSSDVSQLANDMALLELDRPIRGSEIRHFATAMQPVAGAEVGVVSYAHNRSERPALQEVCHIMGHESGALITSCDVDFGASGAPVLSFDGESPTVVSVVSAKAQVGEQKVAIGTAMDAPLAELMAQLSRGDGVFRRATRIRSGGNALAFGDTGGTTFLKP